jgi:hypothetical protein
MHVGVSGHSDHLFVGDGRDQWILWYRKDGVITPNYSECALLGISADKADKFLTDHPPPA